MTDDLVAKVIVCRIPNFVDIASLFTLIHAKTMVKPLAQVGCTILVQYGWPLRATVRSPDKG